MQVLIKTDIIRQIVEKAMKDDGMRNITLLSVKRKAEKTKFGKEFDYISNNLLIWQPERKQKYNEWLFKIAFEDIFGEGW